MAIQYKIVPVPQYVTDVESYLNDLGATASGSWQFVHLYNGQAYLSSGSSGATYTVGNITVPTGTVSSSTQVTTWSVATASYVQYSSVANKPTLVSSSAQAAGWTVLSASYSETASYVNPLNQNVSATGNITAGGNLISSNSSGDEGGEILLAKAQTNTTLTGSGITVDSYQNKLRIFEQGGTARGGYFDLTTLDANAGTDLTKVAISKLGYGQWYSTQTQSGSVNVSSSIVYDSTAFANGFTLVNGSRITALQAGTYNFQFSLQLKNVTNDNILYQLWFKQDGVNVDWSNTIYEIDKQPAAFGSNVAALNYMATMTSGSYLELVWSADHAGARIFATGSVNGRPGVPSAIMTVTQVG